jgi:aminoglycoside 3-N-acetyltransferase
VLKRFAKRLLGPTLQAWHARKRQAELREALPPVTRASLAADLARLPLPREPLLLVHSSMKSLGFVEGGPEAVIAALREAVVDRLGGTVMFPTFTIPATMSEAIHSGRVFDVRETPSRLGALPEAFRRQPDAIRSIHPTHSFAAIGKRAEELVRGHHLAGSNFGAGTPMAQLRDAGGHLLGLGTSLGNVTFYHCLEDDGVLPFGVNEAGGPFPVTVIDWNGESRVMHCHAHDGAVSVERIDRPNNEPLRELYARVLEREAGLTWHQVGQARSWLVSAPAMYQAAAGLIAQGLSVYTAPDAASRALAALRP